MKQAERDLSSARATDEQIRDALAGLEERLIAGIDERNLALVSRLDRLFRLVIHGDQELDVPPLLSVIREHERRILAIEQGMESVAHIERLAEKNQKAVEGIQRWMDRGKWLGIGMAVNGAGLTAILAKLFGAF